MSIFPKRAIPGKTVTIHWNFNISALKNVHVFPWVRIGVKDPNGNVTMLFEEHVLGLPNPINDVTQEKEQSLKYLNKNVPLLLLADYLSGACKREQLIQILKNIQSGRHYYFTYTIPKNAPLGKYTLISEVHSSGEIKYSKTAVDDFFFVERITLNNIVEGEKKNAVVINHSPEKTPIKIVECYQNKQGELKTKVRVFEIEPLQKTTIKLSSNKEFLLYNEEREVLPLTTSSSYLLRNQQVLEIHKKDEKTYLLKKDKDEAYQLTTETKQLWEKSNGLFHKDEMSEIEKAIFKEMSSEELIQEINL
ncbi:hypothetical protein [Aquimarina macrocephali]|uniref:hypothetical protein n=1 Tax=Aquimarina macrocephali TaxID=666563 RepID=UPI000464BE66|nr:hypothetical protein [Aquimarina macrocephali]